jgi:hypothetical protein
LVYQQHNTIATTVHREGGRGWGVNVRKEWAWQSIH